MATNHSSLPIVWRSEADPTVYELARIGRVFNHRRPKRYPVAVVDATKEAHIVETVRLAVERGYRVSIRSGGHSWAAWSVRDEAILIDLGKYHLLDFDESRKTVTVSPSTTGRMLNGFLDEKGLMFAGGHCPDVGLGGFLLQGGMGWNAKNWGWACEKILAVDVVTANGDLVHCDAQQNSDLFWAARGAGPGFPGVVTKFHLEVRPKYDNMLSSTFIYPASEYKQVMKWVLALTSTYDEDTEIVAVGATPPSISSPCIVALFVTFKNTQAEAETALSLANQTRPDGPIVELVNQPTSLAKEYRDQAAANPEGHRYCAENAFVNDDADVASILEEAFTTLPHPKAFALWFPMAPVSRRPLPDMALSMQSDHYFALYTCWEDEADDERCLRWVQDIMRDVERRSQGAYLGDSDFQVRRTRFWSDENGKRLMRIRRERDPKGTVCGFLDVDDKSGVDGLANQHEWLAKS